MLLEKKTDIGAALTVKQCLPGFPTRGEAGVCALPGVNKLHGVVFETIRNGRRKAMWGRDYVGTR